jgi:polyisoprenoid-binding protein YceI
MNRRRVIIAVAAVPLLVVVGFGIYLLGLGGYLPGQVDPTPIGAGITPFADLVGTIATPLASPETRATPGATPLAPGASPIASPAPAVAYVIAGEESRVRYVVQEELAGFPGPTMAIGETQAIAGEIGFDTAGNPLAGSAFQVDLRTLKSDKVRRDNDIKRFFLETETYPIATFVITAVEGLAGGLIEGQPQSFRIVGELTAHGVTRPVTWEATATLTGDTLTGSATTTFLFADFDMNVPNIAGMVSARDPIRLEVEVVATRRG